MGGGGRRATVDDHLDDEDVGLLEIEHDLFESQCVQ
jgi:hypothetical protein